MQSACASSDYAPEGRFMPTGAESSDAALSLPANKSIALAD